METPLGNLKEGDKFYFAHSTSRAEEYDRFIVVGHWEAPLVGAFVAVQNDRYPGGHTDHRPTRPVYPV